MNREQKKTLLEQLQALDPPTKKKVLVTTTVFMVVLVTYVWLGYFNNILASVSQDAIASAASSAPAASEEPSAWDAMKNATGYIYGEVVGGVRNFSQMIGAPKQYPVTPNQ